MTNHLLYRLSNWCLAAMSRGPWYVCKIFSVLNQLWNCYFFHSLTPLLLPNYNTSQTGFLFASCISPPIFMIYQSPLFHLFLKVNCPVFSVSSHMGNFTCPFPFLSPFSELCLALVQASCETWEYWVTSPAYVIPNVNASSTYLHY